MAPHMTPQELDDLQVLQSSGQLSIVEIHNRLASRRQRKGLAVPRLTNVRRVLKRLTFKCGIAETRGRKRAVQAKTLR
eukprot:10441831-Lingulodinium_polyedra.AAC.1